jgi:hypothetical protein
MMKKKEMRTGLSKRLSDVFSGIKRDFWKVFLKTLLFDFLCLASLLIILLVSFALFSSSWGKLGSALPSALKMASAISANPGMVKAYSGELASLRAALDSFMWSASFILAVTLVAFVLCYSFFQMKIFRVLDPALLKKSYWRFVLLDAVLIVFSLLLMSFGLFAFGLFVNVVVSSVFLLFILLLANNACFVFVKTKKVFAALRWAFSLFRPFLLVMFLVLACVFVFLSMLLAALSSLFWGFGPLVLLFGFLVLWSLGRLIIYRVNGVFWKDVK